MFHARKYFRDKIKEYLTPISIIKKLYIDQPVYLEYEDCPALFITTDGESISNNNLGYPRNGLRVLTFTLSLYLKTQENLQDKIDEFCYEIENAFSLSKERVKFENKALSSQISGIDFSFDETQDRDVCKIVFTLEISYNLRENSLNSI